MELYEKKFNASLISKCYKNKWEYLDEYANFIDLLYLKYYSENSSKFSDQDTLFPTISNIKELQQSIELSYSHINQRVLSSVDNELFLPTLYLKTVFELSQFEEFALMVLIISDVYNRYEKIHSMLNNNPNFKQPTINLIINTFYSNDSPKIDNLKFFHQYSKLNKFFLNINEKNLTSFNSTQLYLNKRILGFILNSSSDDTELLGFSKMYTPSNKLDKIIYNNQILGKIINIVNESYKSNNENLILNLYGKNGCGKKFQVKHFSEHFTHQIIFVDINLMMLQKIDFHEQVHIICRESIIKQSVICMYNFDYFFKNEASEEKILYFIKNLNTFSRIVFILSEQILQLKDSLGYNVINIKVDLPNFNSRLDLWKDFSKIYPLDEDINLNQISSKFKFTPKQIKSSILEAFNTCRIEGNTNITNSTMHDSCYIQSAHQLEKKSTRISPIYTWNDLILPLEQSNTLKNACNHIKYRYLVMDEWGFGDKLSYGKGLSILMAGPPGTGKTMAAQVIANDLLLQIYKIQLSQVVSKYIGETEKNLKEIFDEGKNSNCILFFDETDALFGKRSEVKDSHDRYANIETAFLLQQMEEYEGITVMATNYLQNIDEAFIRRINFIVHFPFPSKEYRLQIWKNIFPKAVPLDQNIDYEFISNKFELSGGSIKNIAITSAFLAASRNTAIDMGILIEGIKFELSKTGKIVLKEDLGIWA